MGVTALRSLSARFPTSEPQRRTEPFRSAEEAWFWTMAALMARREGPATRPIAAGSRVRANPTTW